MLFSVGLYLFFCVGLYFFQERLIFFPVKLDSNYVFNYEYDFEEIDIYTQDSVRLNSLLFKIDSPKGLVFYLHGNAGSLKDWGGVSKSYLGLGYDVFILDYRGFGKSEGEISSQLQLFSDVQMAYNKMLENYKEENIIVLGYSIGSGIASKLASVNSPKQLILQAPYFSMVDMMRQEYPFVPTFLLKYKLNTNEYIKNCDMPITLFHGKEDAIIDVNSSLKLNKLIKSTDELIILENQGHNGITDNVEYQKVLRRILN